MHLKQITLVGFKSFADRVALNFEQKNITGVVGPNGSGKSNVIDAVRWVMGEQNTKLLRGEKATDIIFSGSEKRKALGMAEVTLVFDNKEASAYCPEEYRYEEEIALTRRLYLDGQRELFINRKPCRLKDIINFFIDSGVGGRSYSMIQQGQVDRILQAKPEQLREIVEEAAGIVVFKKRNEETRKKLAQVQQNLSRLEDIEKEVQLRASALEEQALKAKKWQEYSARLKEKENEYYCQSYLQQNNRRSGLIDTIELEKSKQEQFKVETSQLEAEQAEKQKVLAEKDPEFAIINEEIAKVREKLASAETELVGVIAKDEAGEKRLKNLCEEIDEEKSHFKEINVQNSKLEKEFREAEDLTKNAENKVEAFSDRIENYSEQILVKENLVEETIKEIAENGKNLDAAKLRADNVSEQFEEYAQEKENFTKKLAGLENSYSQTLILVDSSKVKVKNKEKDLLQKKTEESELREKILENKESLENIKTALEKSKQKYIEYSTRLSFYENRKHWLNELKGFTSSLESKEAEKIAVLSEEINFEDKEGELSSEAIEAFRQWSQRVLIEDLELLPELEAHASEKGLGLIPVSLITEEQEFTDEEKQWVKDQQLISASNFVSKKSCGKEIWSWLGKSVYFSLDDFLSEKQLVTKPKGLVVITQKAAVYVNYSDVALGVSTEDSIEVIEREKQELQVQSQKYVQRIQGENKKLEVLKEKNQKFEFAQIAMADDLHSLKQDHLVVLGEEQKQKQQANLIQEQIQNLRADFQEKMKKNEVYENDKEGLLETIKKLSEKKKELERSLSDLKESKLDFQENLEEVRKQLEDFRFEKISAETKLQTFESSRNQNKQQIASFKARLDKLTETFTYTENEHLENKEKKTRLEEDLVSLGGQKGKLEKLLSSKKSENLQLTGEIRKTEDKIRKLKAESDKISNRIQDKKLALEKIEMQIENLEEQAFEKCKIKDLAALEIEAIENFNPQNIMRQVSNLRTKIEDLGLINMVAVQEYDELSKRKEFIQTQKQEVEAAIGLLELAIDEITESSEKKFLTAYDRLNEEFKELFPILFPRGKGELILTNSEKVLESGVEIMVRLPGKAFQSMRLFSGGEKALTAIALIFALLKSKPTPFCFLDEVDAALDETNVGHYNRLLESLSDRFQFIVITHRRKTMEVLDTLYGVTMQEPGVSKVVGVDLSKTLPAHLQKAFKEKELPKIPAKPEPPAFDI